jgi:tetratricopeptide (TPR) repeat protein
LFPTSLGELVPKYLDALPACPAAGKDTYSNTYESARMPDAFSVRCGGSAHKEAGAPEDFPMTSSAMGVAENPEELERLEKEVGDSVALVQQVLEARQTSRSADELVLKGKYGEAINRYTKAINAIFHMDLASLKKSDGLGELAGDLATMRSDTLYRSFLGRSYCLLMTGRVAVGLKDIDEMLLINPNPARHYRAAYLVSAGRYEEALPDFAEVLTQSRDKVRILVQRSMTYLCLGRGAEAAADGRAIRSAASAEERASLPYGYYADILTYLGERQAKQAKAAREALAQYDPVKLRKAVWPAPIILYLRGKLAEKELLGRGTKGQRVEARLVVGMEQSFSGKRSDAIRNLRIVESESVPHPDIQELMYWPARSLARAELKRLEKK